MILRVGTSGFSYKPWKGPFYPEDLPDDRMLEYYAGQLPAVEIDNTFYRMPKKDVLRKWYDTVPPEFRFSIKASRRITHFKRLKGTEEEMSFLMGNLEVLGDRLGAVLFQLPPFLRKDAPRLSAFLDLVPTGLRAAFEFRHASWFDEEIHTILREHGAALCHADTPDPPKDGDEAPKLVPTAEWGYLRLRRDAYDADALSDWLATIRSSGWNEAFVFFKHEDAGAGPRLAGRLLELAGGADSGPSD